MTKDYLFLWSSYVAGKSVPTLWLRWPEASYSYYSIHIRLFIRISSWKGKECPFQYMSDICKAMSKGYGAILIRNLKVDQIIHIIPFDHDRLFIRISNCTRSIFKSFVDMKNEGMSGTWPCRAMIKAYGAIKSRGLFWLFHYPQLTFYQDFKLQQKHLQEFCSYEKWRDVWNLPGHDEQSIWGQSNRSDYDRP